MVGGAFSLARCRDAEMAPVNRSLTDTNASGQDEHRDAELAATGSCEPLPTRRGDAEILACESRPDYTNEWTRRAQRHRDAGSCAPLAACAR